MKIESFVEALKAFLPEKQIYTSDRIGADYCHDEYPGGDYRPDVVVEALSTQEVSEVLRLCSAQNVPVTVRGAGTGQAGGAVAVEGGLVLSLKGMNRILDFDEATGILHVEAGALLQDVKAAALERGLFYPPDPGEQTATLGGNAATDAGGPCAVKYGSTRDYVAGAVLVLADGEITGLAGHEAVLGAEGTLAVLTELHLRLLKKPGAQAILLFPFPDARCCISAATALQASGYAPALLEYIDTDLVEFAGGVTGNPVFPVEIDGERVGATLMARLEGEDDDAVMAQMESIAELGETLGCLDILVGDTTAMMREIMEAHAAFHSAMESGARCACELNVTVPPAEVADFVTFCKALGEKAGLRVMAYAHVGSGGVHVHAVSDCEKDAFAAHRAVFEAAAYEECAARGGDIAGEYGVGYAKKKYLSEAARAAFALKKAAYDPKGILNPGKLAGRCAQHGGGA